MRMIQTLEAVQRYWDDYARNLTIPGTGWATPEFFAILKSRHNKAYAYANQILDLRNLRGRSLLELGCGIGLDTVEFARHGTHVTAIDLSPVCVQLTKNHLAYNNVSAAVEIGNAEDLKYPANSFEVVVARGILMFTPQESRIVGEIFRVLKPGGVAHILLHNRLSWYALLGKISRTNLVHEEKDPPISRLHCVWTAKRMFHGFSSVEVFLDRFPCETSRRGLVAALYNSLLAPALQIIPKPLMRPLAYYIIVKAIK